MRRQLEFFVGGDYPIAVAGNLVARLSFSRATR